MAHERRRELHRHGGAGARGRAARLARGIRRALTLAAAALVVAGAAGLAGCTAEPLTSPGQALPPPGGGGGGTSSSPLAFFGSWRALIVVPLDGDIQRTTTTWQFGSDGSCRLTQDAILDSEGILRTTVRDCTWELAGTGASLAVTFDDGGTATLTWSQDAFSPDQLVLDGVTFDRVA